MTAKPSGLTGKAVLLGATLGLLLLATNLSMGLKTGWWDSGTVTAALLGAAVLSLWRAKAASEERSRELNVVQGLASAVGAMPASAGLLGAVAAMNPRPAPVVLIVWGTGVGLLGLALAALLRAHLVEREALPFPTGTATAAVIAAAVEPGGDGGRASRAGLRRFAAGALLSALIATARDVFHWLPAQWAVGGASWARLSLGVMPSPMMLAIGALVGPRIALSLLVGAGAAWLGLGPWLLSSGRVTGGFEDLSAWLMWPGVGLLSGGAVAWLVRELGRLGRHTSAAAWALTRHRARALGAVLALSGLLVLTIVGMGVPPLLALAGLVLSVPVAAVCARAAGETDFAPVGQVGQLAQGGLGLSGSGAGALGGAALSAGAATQVAVSLWSHKAVAVSRGSFTEQWKAQAIGVTLGGLVSVPVWLLLQRQHALGSKELPAPSMIAWKALAQATDEGFAAFPPGALTAAAVAFGAGLVLALNEKRARWLPSVAAVGVGFVAPAAFSLTIALGAAIAWLVRQRGPSEEAVQHFASGALTAEAVLAIALAVLAA